jgi:transposase
MGRLAKTGRIDAQMLAELTAVLVRRADLARFLRPLSDEQQLLAALVTRRRQLQTMLTSERQRLQIALPKVRPSIEAMIQTIRAQLDEVEGQMLNHLREHFTELDSLLRSTTGIEPIASANWDGSTGSASALSSASRQWLTTRAMCEGDDGSKVGDSRSAASCTWPP